MAGVAEYSTTAASNTTINSIGIQGSNNVQNFDNGFRQLMADLATARTDGQMASMPYVAKSAGYTVAVTDRGKLIDCTAALELDLPAAATAGAGFYFIAKANGGAVTVDPNGTENINGSSTSATVADGSSAIVVCNGSAWFSVTILGTISSVLTTLATLFTPASSSGAASLAFHEDTDNGTNKITLKGQATLASDIEVSLPATAGTLALQSEIETAVPVGTVSFYAGASAPSGWLLCYGQAIDRTTYADLFTAISTTYGAGDGSTTFNLPDIRGRVIAGQDDMGGSSANRLTNQTGGLNGDTLGATGGSETHALTGAQIPDNETNTRGTGAVSTATSGHTGTGDAHNNVQPTIILNAIIYAGV